jgi:hypothetical protein
MLMALKEEGLLGDYHLLLAHDVASQPTLYHDIFHDVDAYIIMDNSTVELGHPVDTDVMLVACAAVPADVVVLPDTIRDAEATIRDCVIYSLEWGKAKLGPFMVVPQGETWTELCACAQTLSYLPNISAWGVGRFVQAVLGSRIPFTWWLRNITLDPTIHMLGFSDHVHDDIRAMHMPCVAGIDSAVPIRMGLAEIGLDAFIKTPPRGDYWETASEVTELVRYNLAVARSWAELG